LEVVGGLEGHQECGVVSSVGLRLGGHSEGSVVEENVAGRFEDDSVGRVAEYFVGDVKHIEGVVQVPRIDSYALEGLIVESGEIEILRKE